MSDPVSLASLFDAAEQAALNGDFATAARLLGEAARAQEATLGPDHLDLANTLNNLAVAHERSGQLDAAEREYRRAHAIAARTRPADDPLVTTSAQNLREFCQANGRPVEVPPSAMTLADDVPTTVTTPAVPKPASQADVPTGPLPITFAAERAPGGPRADRPVRDTSVRSGAPQSKPRATPAPRPAPAAPAAASAPVPFEMAAPRRRVSVPVLVALGALAALLIWLLAGRGPATPSGDTTAAASDTAPSAPSGPPADPAPTPPAAAPAAAAPAATPAPTSAPSTEGARAPVSASAGGVTIGDAQLCTSLSSSYRCDAAGATVRPGRLVFYTRLIADHSTSVMHRWYRGNELRQTIRLDVPARRQGFRTFSRATVSASEGEWRVELRSREGQILHTERFTVR
jgi:hypothetical protein